MGEIVQKKFNRSNVVSTFRKESRPVERIKRCKSFTAVGVSVVTNHFTLFVDELVDFQFYVLFYKSQMKLCINVPLTFEK